MCFIYIYICEIIKKKKLCILNKSGRVALKKLSEIRKGNIQHWVRMYRFSLTHTQYLNECKFLFENMRTERSMHHNGLWSPSFSIHTISRSYTAECSMSGIEVFLKASFISLDGLNAPRSKRRFGASLYVAEEITAVIQPVHQGVILSSSCTY